MDKFFNQKYCDRCGGDLADGRTMSMFNTDCICKKCKQAEMERKDYKLACEEEKKAVEKGVKNYSGIGYKP